jgi:hypothetical protein
MQNLKSRTKLGVGLQWILQKAKICTGQGYIREFKKLYQFLGEISGG